MAGHHGSFELAQSASTAEAVAAAGFESAPFPLCIVHGVPLRVAAPNGRFRALVGTAAGGELLADVLEQDVARRIADAVQHAAATGESVTLAEQRLRSAPAGELTPAAATGRFDVTVAPLDPASPGLALMAIVDLATRRAAAHEAARIAAESVRERAAFDHALAAGLEEGGRPGLQRDWLRRQLSAAEENERRRLARELHDQLGQHLTALTLGLSEVADLLPAGSDAVARLASLSQLTTLLTRDVRYLAVELRPPELDDVGLGSAMATYIALWTSRFHVAIDFEITGSGDAPSTEVGSAVYRIMQESLTNIAKHAEARQASVILDLAPHAVRLICEDDGQGFDPIDRRSRAHEEGRVGLAGMHERALLLGGTFQVESAPGYGTTVFVTLPRHGDRTDAT